MPAQNPEIRLSPADARAPWGADMRAKSERALRYAEKRLGLTLDRPVEVISLRSDWDLEQYVGERPAHVFALARPERSEIVISRPAWMRADFARQEQVLVHEMTHLILGRRVAGELPVWLNEGLAMIVAGESDFEYAWRINVAGALGGLLPLEVLKSASAFKGESQDLAYAQSLYITRFYLERSGLGRKGDPDDPAPLARALADPQNGPALLRQLWDPYYQMALEMQWRGSRRTIWNWLSFLSGATVLWLFIALLFLLAYWRKRRMARLLRERFAVEESRDTEFGTETPPWEYEGGEDDEEKH